MAYLLGMPTFLRNQLLIRELRGHSAPNLSQLGRVIPSLAYTQNTGSVPHICPLLADVGADLNLQLACKRNCSFLAISYKFESRF